MTIDIKTAFGALKKAMKKDPDYAWSWHCNIACSVMDAGATHKVANDGAGRFMKLCFDVDTSRGPTPSFKQTGVESGSQDPKP